MLLVTAALLSNCSLSCLSPRTQARRLLIHACYLCIFCTTISSLPSLTILWANSSPIPRLTVPSPSTQYKSSPPSLFWLQLYHGLCAFPAKAMLRCWMPQKLSGYPIQPWQDLDTYQKHSKGLERIWLASFIAPNIFPFRNHNTWNNNAPGNEPRGPQWLPWVCSLQ